MNWCVTWSDCILQMFCSSAAGHSTTPNPLTHTVIQNHCHIPDAVWGSCCCTKAAWGPKSSMEEGWLHNLIAWIISLFFVVKFLFLCSLMASSCGMNQCQASTTADITVRPPSNNSDGLKDNNLWTEQFLWMLEATQTSAAEIIVCYNITRQKFKLCVNVLTNVSQYC